MKAIIATLLIIMCTTGCIGIRPGSIGIDGRMRGYNGRNAGETVGEQSIVGNTVQLVLPNQLDPKSAAALAEGISNMFSNQMGASDVKQDFAGGGIQTGEEKDGWLTTWMKGNDKKPAPVTEEAEDNGADE